MEPILTIDNLNSFGGNMLRQGDKSQLKYRLRDVGNKNLAISSKPCQVRMYGRNYTTVVYETSTTVSSDNTVTFTIDKVLPKGTFYLEFTVGDYIFPTDHKEFFEITPSGKGMEANIIEIVGVDTVVRKAVDLINKDPSLIIDEDKLVTDIISNTGIGNIDEYYKAFNDLKPRAELSISKSAEALTKSQNALNVANGIDAKATNALDLSKSADTLSKSVQEQFNQVVIDGDSSVEAAQARVDASGQTNPTLKARLDKEHNEVTTQLAQTFKKNETGVLDLNVFDEPSRNVLQGQEPGTINAVLGEENVHNENIAKKAVSLDKTNFVKKTKNLFDGNYLDKIVGRNESHSGVMLYPRNNFDSNLGKTAVIPIEPNETYTIKVHDPEMSNAFRIGIHSEYPVFEDTNVTPLDELVYAPHPDDGIREYTITNTDTGKYLLVYVSNEGKEPRLQVEKGDIATDYIDGLLISNEFVEKPNLSIEDVSGLTTEIKDNIFDQTYLRGYFLAYRTSIEDPDRKVHTFSAGESGVVAVVPVEAGSTYYVKTFDDSDRLRIATFETEPTDGSPTIRGYEIGDSENEASLELNENENFLAVQVSNSGEEPRMVINNTGFIDHYVNSIVINPKYMPSTEDLFEVGQYNEFDEVYHQGIILAVRNGSEIYEFREDYNLYPEAITIVVPTTSNTNYFVKKFDKGDRFRIATFDHEPTNGSVPIRGFLRDESGDSFEFTTETNEKYIAIQLSNSAEKPRVVINSTGFTDKYISPKTIKSLYLPEIVGSSTQKREFILSGAFNEYYRTEELTGLNSGDFVLRSSTIDDIYGLYDELVLQYPNFITRNHRGNGYNSSGVVDESYPVYEYVISAPETTQETHTGGHDTRLKKSPLILITSGTHGDEKAAVWGVYQFVKQLMGNPNNSDGLEDLKSMVSFKIIPIVNPGGYNANTRNNTRNVNINRNFAPLWEESNDSGKGSSPYSEIETQIIRDWFIENNHASAYLDYHNFTRNFTGRQVEMASYHLSPNEDMDAMYSSLIRRLSNRWRDRYFSNFADLGNVAYGFVHSGYYATPPSTINEAYHVHGIKLSATPEATHNDPVTTSSINTKTVVETNAELFINYVLATIDNFISS